jgi:hypothetical protein
MSRSLQDAVSEIPNPLREPLVQGSGTTASVGVSRRLDLEPFEDPSRMKPVILPVDDDRTRGPQWEYERCNLQICEGMVRRQASSVDIANVLDEVE